MHVFFIVHVCLTLIWLHVISCHGEACGGRWTDWIRHHSANRVWWNQAFKSSSFLPLPIRFSGTVRRTLWLIVTRHYRQTQRARRDALASAARSKLRPRPPFCFRPRTENQPPSHEPSKMPPLWKEPKQLFPLMLSLWFAITKASHPSVKRCHFLPSAIAVMWSHPETNPGNNRD